MLDEQTNENCQLYAEEIDTYVEDWHAGENLAVRHPDLYQHLQSCANCRETIDLLYDLLSPSITSVIPEPQYLTFGEWVAIETRPSPSAPLWQQVAEQTYRLIPELTFVFTQTRMIFAELPAMLTPLSMPAVAYRSSDNAESVVEVLELPHHASNLVIRLSASNIVGGTGTLALKLSQIDPPTPLTQAKVTLSDSDGSLLEGASSDEEGFVYFSELETGRYRFTVEALGRSWDFSFTLR